MTSASSTEQTRFTSPQRGEVGASAPGEGFSVGANRSISAPASPSPLWGGTARSAKGGGLAPHSQCVGLAPLLTSPLRGEVGATAPGEGFSVAAYAEGHSPLTLTLSPEGRGAERADVSGIGNGR